MKHQTLFYIKEKSKKLKCRLLQFLFGALRAKFSNKLLQITILQKYIQKHLCDQVLKNISQVLMML